MNRPDSTFVITTPTRDLDEFSRLAELARPLQRYGRVQLNVASLAGPSTYEMPDGGSPWHAYAAYNPALEKFVPHADIAPHLPAEFVTANRQLLQAKAAVLRVMGLGAAFWCYLPNFLPESFFEAHPALRGPRTDHPRRSLAAAFAPCVDHPRVREMIRSMTAELCRLVPEMGTLYFKTNDAGPGLCWSHWQYAGSNGPVSCRGVGMGKRVRGLLDALCEGGADAGVDLRVHFTGNFNDRERNEIAGVLPDHCSMRGGSSGAGSPLTLGCMADRCYPVRGLFDPLMAIKTMAGMRPGQTVFVDFRCAYDRAGERLDVAERVVEVVGRAVAEPVRGPLGPLQRLREHCAAWVGEGRADDLTQAFVDLHDVLADRQKIVPGLSPIYGGVSLRYITRPLVWDPMLLAGPDERYFLPHVFNVDVDRARMDWLDQHGSRLAPYAMPPRGNDPRLWAVDGLGQRLDRIGEALRAFADGPIADVLHGAARACSLYASILRSCANFYAGQIIRERVSPQVIASDWTGHPDFASFQEIVRDEMDNASRFESLLRDGGLELISHASGTVVEGTFVLGVDLIDQVRTKQRLMRRHWRDAEATLKPPNR